MYGCSRVYFDLKKKLTCFSIFINNIYLKFIKIIMSLELMMRRHKIVSN